MPKPKYGYRYKPPISQMPPSIRISEAAFLFGRDPDWIAGLITTGQVQGFRDYGGAWRISLLELAQTLRFHPRGMRRRHKSPEIVLETAYRGIPRPESHTQDEAA